MERVGLDQAEIVRIVVLGVILLLGLGVLRLVLRLTARVLAGGCLAIILVVAVLVILARFN